MKKRIITLLMCCTAICCTMATASILGFTNFLTPSITASAANHACRPGSKYVVDRKPTCTTNGNGHYNCTICGKRLSNVTIKKLGHQYGPYKVTKNPTCSATGQKYHQCQRSGCTHKEYATIPKNSSAHSMHPNKVIAPTCTTKGYDEWKCSYCSHTEKKNYKNAYGHNYGNWVISKQATCTSTGQKYRQCKRKGCTHKEYATIPAKGHSMHPNKVIAPTCTTQGYDEWKCSYCSHTEKKNYKNAYGHNYSKSTIIRPATCTTNGQRKLSCSRCTSTKTETIPYKGHSMHPNKVIAPTCTTRGYDEWKCSYCSHTEKKNYKNAYGHNYGAYKIIKNPTCTATGQKYRECTRNSCKHKQYVTIPKNPNAHAFKYTTVEPTLNTPGKKIGRCTNAGCQKTTEQILSPVIKVDFREAFAAYFDTEGKCKNASVGKEACYYFKANYDWTITSNSNWVSVKIYPIKDTHTSDHLFNAIHDKHYSLQSGKKDQLYAVMIRADKVTKWTEKDRESSLTIKCKGYNKKINVWQEKITATWDYLDKGTRDLINVNDIPYFKGEKETNGISIRYIQNGNSNINGKQIKCYSFETVNKGSKMVEYAFYSARFDTTQNSTKLCSATVEVVKSSATIVGGGFVIQGNNSPLITVSVNGSDSYISTNNFSYTTKSTDKNYQIINGAVKTIINFLTTKARDMSNVKIVSSGINAFIKLTTNSFLSKYDNSDTANVAVGNCSLTVELPKGVTLNSKSKNNNEMVQINFEAKNPKVNFNFTIKSNLTGATRNISL